MVGELKLACSTNSTWKMPSAEGVLCKLTHTLVIEREKIWKEVFKGSEE